MHNFFQDSQDSYSLDPAFEKAYVEAENTFFDVGMEAKMDAYYVKHKFQSGGSNASSLISL